MKIRQSTEFSTESFASFHSRVAALAYPLDGYEETGIRRVEGARLANEGLAIGGFQPPGAMLTTEQVDLRLVGKNLALPTGRSGIYGADRRHCSGSTPISYGIAVLDLSDPEILRYAEHRGNHRQNVGSVGKLLVALGLFQALADTWPDDLDRRKDVLRDTMMTADNFLTVTITPIRIFNVETRELIRRPIADGDQGSLWEYLDWMLSVSSNSAAAMVMRDAMLLQPFWPGLPGVGRRDQNFLFHHTRRRTDQAFPDRLSGNR